jgi:hypothetical protein
MWRVVKINVDVYVHFRLPWASCSKLVLGNINPIKLPVSIPYRQIQ